jgi:hypothetical protein
MRAGLTRRERLAGGLLTWVVGFAGASLLTEAGPWTAAGIGLALAAATTLGLGLAAGRRAIPTLSGRRLAVYLGFLGLALVGLGAALAGLDGLPHALLVGGLVAACGLFCIGVGAYEYRRAPADPVV